MTKIKNRTRLASTLAICTFLASSMAMADGQDITKTIETSKTERVTPSESSQSSISDQIGQAQTESQQSESTNKPATPDHPPSVFIRVAPLSSNIDIGKDFTPGIFGLIMNVAYAANSVRQATSDKFKVFYLEEGKTIFLGRGCIYRALEIDDAKTVSKIVAGDLINVTRVSSQWSVDQVKDGELAKKVDTSHACYERFQKLTAKSE